MSTVQMIKPSETTFQSNWEAIFPDFTTLVGSRQFIKKLMAVSLSALTYLRGIFPERAFGERNFCGIKLKLLTEDSGIDVVDKFIDLVRSCYEAVDKKYLEQICIGICTDPENKDEVLESYNINLIYRDDEYCVTNKTSTMKLEENDPTVQATFLMLKSIFYVTEILSPLPKDAYLTVKLLFNDDITPQDYEPPGFEPSENEKFFFPSNAVKLQLGKVSTEFNNYRMFLKTALSKEPLSQVYEESVQNASQQSQSNMDPEQPEMYDEPSLNKSSLKSDERASLKHMQENIECVCTCKEDTDTKFLECGSCGKKQHSICYGILDTPDNDFEFYCIQCVDEAPFRSSQEDVIYRYEEKDQRELCAFRRALVFCASLKLVTAFQLQKGLKCDKQLAKDLLAKLEIEGYIKKSGQKYIVNEKMITNKGYWKYFQRTEDKENVENSGNSKPSPAKQFDDVDFTKETNKKKTETFTLDEIPPEEDYMDYSVANEVKKLNLKGSQEKQANRTSRRRSLKAMTSSDDFEETFQKKPSKRRCLNKKEVMNVKH